MSKFWKYLFFERIKKRRENWSKAVKGAIRGSVKCAFGVIGGKLF
jgi:hypothetical protein